MSKYKLVEVYDDVVEVWIPRNVIFFNNNGSVISVRDEEEQLDDDYIVNSTSFFAKYREIQQPTWKPFPDNESMEHLKDCWFRFKDDTRQFRTERYDYDYYSVFYILGNWWSKEDLFEKVEVLTNGKWQPVGVEEC